MPGKQNAPGAWAKGRLRAMGMIACGAGVIGAIAYGEGLDPSIDATSAVSPATDTPEDSDARLRELERISRRTEARLLALQAAQSETRQLRLRVAELEAQRLEESSPEPEVLDEVDSEHVEDALQAPDTDREETVLAALDALHASEPIDRGWSREMNQRFDSLFSEGPAATGNRLQDVSCRTSHCVLLVEHDGTAGPQSLSRAMLDPAFAGGLIARRSDDSSSTRIFAFRPGYEDALAALSGGKQ